MGIDMWSLGCILAELHSGHPIFPGENEHEQLICIMEIFGVPPANILELSKRKKLFFDSSNEPKIIMNSRGRKRKISSRQLNVAVKSNDQLFLDFLEKCFEWDPEKRLKPHEAMEHPFITESLSKENSKAPSPAEFPSIKKSSSDKVRVGSLF
ncbi:kinase-like protein, partial [Rozella allomycis CSF55]